MVCVALIIAAIAGTSVAFIVMACVLADGFKRTSDHEGGSPLPPERR